MDILLLKIAMSFFLAWGLVAVAERFSVRAAGILSSLPNVSLLVMLFIGIEQGLQFSSTANLFGVYGIGNNIVCAAVAIFLVRRQLHYGFVLLGLLVMYLTVACTSVYVLPVELFSAVVSVFLIWVFLMLFLRQKVAPVKIERVQRTRGRQLVTKFIIILSLLMATTYIAPLIGEEWSGFVGTLPAVTLPVGVTIAAKYDRTTLQFFLFSAMRAWLPTAIYFAVITWAYAEIGIVLGTLIGVLSATAVAIAVAMPLKTRS